MERYNYVPAHSNTNMMLAGRKKGEKRLYQRGV
jgi:hypothetical protein